MKDFLTILPGDCREILPTLPAESVHCCVTSPPYWGLRDYGTAKWEGGSPDCDHVTGEMRRGLGLAGSVASTRGGGHKAAEVQDIQASVLCPKCGAVRVDSQMGLEKTPKEYVAGMVAVFREVRRVLRDDGTLWLNMGDSYYNGDKGGHERTTTGKQTTNRGTVKGLTVNRLWQHDLKPKDLVGMPWRLAFALQADGWWLRQDIIWHKPNPMPESVTDRCTKAHEYLFLLAKGERYFYDAEAVKEPLQESSLERGYAYSDPEYVGAKMKAAEAGEVRANGTWHGKRYVPAARNKRSVWTVTTEPYAEAHFATFPPDLIKPCILAGCPIGGTVLDPFGGSGTTGMVALELGRNAVLIELNPEYVKLAERRCHVTRGLPL